MRLNARLIKEATAELLAILKEYPGGLPTSSMSGTQKFHGGRTLRNRQIIKLLRATNEVDEFIGGHGMRTFLIWKLRQTPAQDADQHGGNK
jgi:hypothetical protein